ncbi:hypothetical protein [Streptomyces pilosus]|uniref:hypothetical protein n=1 Tax=Streptomyces pilosus TaxID=28893 RepID=UPI00167699BA|nr:hypothetical protein [Streptomyces pilosus]
MAATANKHADEANEKSAESNRIAREANSLAEVANQHANEANDIASRHEQRSVEQHDVKWEGGWVAPGRYVLSRRGTHVAVDVVARVTVDDEEKEVLQDRVGPGEQLVLEFPQALRNLQAERLEYRERERTRNTRPYSFMSASDNSIYFRSHTIEEWVQWKTETGAPREHVSEARLATLGDLT